MASATRPPSTTKSYFFVLPPRFFPDLRIRAARPAPPTRPTCAPGCCRRSICWFPTSLVLDDKVAMVVVDDNDVVVENTVVDDAQRSDLVDIDERTWREIAEGQVVNVGRLDLVVHIGLRHERSSWPDASGASLGASETDHVFL